MKTTTKVRATDHRCGRKPSGEEVSFSLRYSMITDRLNTIPNTPQVAPSPQLQLSFLVARIHIAHSNMHIFFGNRVK